ncbi:MAG: hypothetical protein EON58_02205 [Alphaproteobacteria bacterium]|nr:MAG: hypothetical protein EON58_02205 [Alphaproteobacteria bacterium]
MQKSRDAISGGALRMIVLKADPPLKFPSQEDYAEAANKWARSLEAAVRRGLSGELSESEFVSLFYARVYDTNLESWVLGRARGGDLTGGPTYNDQVQARRLADFQSEFIDRFSSDLVRGRYSEEKEGPEAGLRRARAYAMQARGGANEAFVAAQEPSEAIAWIRNAKESCKDCIDLASKTWTASTLYEFPGEGHTECRFNCQCELQIIRTGIACFSREDLTPP